MKALVIPRRNEFVPCLVTGRGARSHAPHRFSDEEACRQYAAFALSLNQDADNISQVTWPRIDSPMDH